MSKTNTRLKPINTPVYGYWGALYHSFYSRQLYVDVGKRWKGFAFVYLLLTIAILSIPFALIIGSTFNEFFTQEIINPLLKLPTIYVQNGEASIDKPMPYLIENNKGQVVLIVDTTGVVNEFSAKYPNLSILINKDKMSYRIPTPQFFKNNQPEVNTRIPIVQKFNKGANSVFDGKNLVNDGAMTRLKYLSELMTYPIIIAILFSFFIVMFPVIALLAQVFARVFFAFQITYPQACRLLIVSSTPMLLALLIFLSANIMFSGMGIILIALLGAYYSFALHSLKAESLHVVAP